MDYIGVMMVDDDYLVIEDLETLVNWEDLGFRINATALNAKKALDLYNENMFQVLITDIRMPGSDGFSLIKAVRNINPEIISMILTSYDDFGYARKALEYRVFDYILKNEISAKSLTEKLAAIKIEIEKRRHPDASSGIVHAGLEAAQYYSKAVIDALVYIEKHFSDPNLWGESIAECSAMSYGRLGVLFKKETGKTIGEYITNCRIEKAIDLLKNSNYKIYEISEKVGYRSPQYFSQVFAQHTKKHPLDYRLHREV
jgi:two-component system response regulator YesN